MEDSSEVTATTTPPSEWINDWDLLSPRFQREATAYLQVIGVVVALFLVKKRARAFATLWRRRDEGNTPASSSTPPTPTEAS